MCRLPNPGCFNLNWVSRAVVVAAVALLVAGLETKHGDDGRTTRTGDARLVMVVIVTDGEGAG